MNCDSCPIRKECAEINKGSKTTTCLIAWAVARTAAGAMADLLREEMSLGSEYAEAVKGYKKFLMRILQSLRGK